MIESPPGRGWPGSPQTEWTAADGWNRRVENDEGCVTVANADIVMVGPGELPLITDIFNQVFRPGRDVGYFERRLRGQHNPVILLAQVDRRPAGFTMGYELKASTYYCWLLGVLPPFRQAGIASQLVEAISAYARERAYHVLRVECYNRARPMLKIAINHGFDIVGMRFDTDETANLIILEQNLTEQESVED